MAEQAKWADHAAFMNRLADEGFVVLGSPLGDGKKILLIVDAQTEEAVHARLAADPWMQIELLRVAKIVPWLILLGDEKADPARGRGGRTCLDWPLHSARRRVRPAREELSPVQRPSVLLVHPERIGVFEGENAAHAVPAALAIGDRGPCAEERTSPSGAGMRRMALFTPPGMN